MGPVINAVDIQLLVTLTNKYQEATSQEPALPLVPANKDLLEHPHMIHSHMARGCFQAKTQLSSWSQHYMVHNAENTFHLFLKIVQRPWLSGSVQACCG